MQKNRVILIRQYTYNNKIIFGFNVNQYGKIEHSKMKMLKNIIFS